MENRFFGDITRELLFPRIFKSFRMAIQPAKIIIAFAAIILVCLLGLLMDLSKPALIAPFSNPDISSVPGASGLLASSPTELHAYVSGLSEARLFRSNFDFPANHTGVFNLFARFCTARFTDGAYQLLALNPVGTVTQLAYCGKALEWALVMHPLYSFVFFGFSFIILAFAGGAISRIAALEFANDEKPGVLEALRFAASKWKSIIVAPILPIATLTALGIPLILAGAFGNIGFHIGDILMVVFTLFFLICAFLMTLLFIGTLGGINLLIPAIAFESTDSFDAISRSIAYVYARPWRLGFYTLITAVYGAICYVFVQFFAFIFLGLARTFVRLGVWQNAHFTGTNKLDTIWPRNSMFTPPVFSDLSTLTWSEQTAAVVISIIILSVLCLIGAFVMSFFFSANSVIYALLRHIVDRTSLKEVWTSQTANPQPTPSDQLPHNAKQS